MKDVEHQSAEGENLHRNNAAEWIMLVVLWPIARVARFLGRRSSKEGE